MDLETHSFIDEQDVLFGFNWEEKIDQPVDTGLDSVLFDELNSIIAPESTEYNEPQQASQYTQPPQIQQPNTGNNNILFCHDVNQLHALQNTFSMNNVPFIIVNVAQQQQALMQQQQQYLQSPHGFLGVSPAGISPATPCEEFSVMSLSFPRHATASPSCLGKRRESVHEAEDLVKRMRLDHQFGTRFSGPSTEQIITVQDENESEQLVEEVEIKGRMRRSRTISGIPSKTASPASDLSSKRNRVQKIRKSQTLNNLSSNAPTPNTTPITPATPMTPSNDEWSGTRTEFRYLVSMGQKRRKNKRNCPEDAYISKFSLKF